MPRNSRTKRAEERAVNENDPYRRLSAAVGRDWPMLDRARADAAELRARIGGAVAGLLNAEDVSVVVFGSLARGELTSRSDTDWTLLVDSQASPEHAAVVHDVANAIARFEQKEPGREGTFGVLASSHELLHNIGGSADTNRNLTQRILLLLESAAMGPAEARSRVVNGVLSRYISEDPGWGTKTVTVPRFLLNDIARYWRTVAVDFAYKRRERNSEGWAIRTVKLRLSRKLTYASGLLACFSCASAPGASGSADRSLRVMDHLLKVLEMTPLERMAALLLDAGLAEPAGLMFDSYDSFLRMIDTPEVREELEALLPEDADRSDTFQRARVLGRVFQGALDEVFFGPRSPYLGLTHKYGVF
jgi:predicted nucleotidyltransferase